MITLLLLTMTLTLAAQTTPGSDASFLSGDQKLVRMAIDSSIYIVRQDYTLTNRSGNEYGRNGKSYFGRTYSLGVKANGRIRTDGRVLRPWETDGNYDKFRMIDTIQPRLSNTAVRQVVQAGYVQVNTDSEGANGQDSSHGNRSDNGKEITVVGYAAADSLPDIELAKGNRDRTGWLAVVSTKETLSANDTVPVSYTIYKAQPQFGANGPKGYIKNMPVKDNVIGGIYYLSTVRLGRISFYAAGILEKDKEGWYIRLFSSGGPSKKAEDLTPLNPLNNPR